MISKEEVEHIAKLARLELTEKEVGKMQKDLTSILDYFNLLKNVPDVKVASVKTSKTSEWMRGDQEKPRISGVAEKLIAGAPDKKDGYIKVKTIL